MSEVMSDPVQTDALAAEYVLGTLDFEERTQAQALLVIDQEFVAKVRLWERRLGELHLMVEPVEPEGRLWDRIKAKMPEPPPKPEIKPAEPAVESPTPPSGEGFAADAAPAPTPEPPLAATPSDDPIAIGLPVAPSIPSPPSSLVPSLTPGVLPSSASSPGSALPLTSMGRPLPSPASDAVPGFLTAPSLPSSPTQSAPASAAAAVLAPSVQPLAASEREAIRREDSGGTRRSSFWRILAVLMTLVVVALGGLIAAWRFAPEHVPPMLHPAELMRAVGITVSGGPPARRPAPPESQFDE
jgi:anti-sigma-K factor RskA